jgi:cell wall-associated NlpC family hydrolase
MNKYFQGVMWALLASGLSVNSWSGEKPIFLVTPNVTVVPSLVQGQLGTAIYQVINNSGRTLSNIQLTNLPNGVTQVSNPGPDYCTSLSQLSAPGSLCLIELQVNAGAIINISGGPKVCALGGLFCSQPFSTDQLSTQITAGPISQTCAGNVANFSYELSQPFATGAVTAGWGPNRNHLLLSLSNPNLTACPTTDLTNTPEISWMQSRVLAAEDFWVKQKMNYCHHHVTDFYTPTTVLGGPRTAIAGSNGGYCSNATSLAPANYGQQIRWNYSGTGSETANNWVNNNRSWYGVDCSDFTSFIYNFAFGIQFNSDTGYQAGQATDGSQASLTPNSQTALNLLQPFDNTNPNSSAGVLLCKDGSTEVTTGPNAFCGGFGIDGYFSVFRHTDDAHLPSPHASDISAAMLNLLQPGDLIFLAFPPGADGNNTTSVVTHVITWTGKQVGYGPNNVNPSQIAPESICPASDWQPSVGDWVIIDSHYQGADYRVFSACFYQNNIWGVRRVVGYMM